MTNKQPKHSGNQFFSSEPHGEFSRELTLFHVTMMGLGMMIGAGVFIGMGISIDKAGPGGVVLTFTFNGLLAIFTAMSFAELSSAIPRAGGVYNFARIGFGKPASFLAGWMEWFASSTAGAMYALVFSIYTLRFFDTLHWLDWMPISLERAEVILAVATALLFIYINYRGASETGKIGAIITVGQTIFVVCIGLVGLWTAIKDPVRLQNFDPFLPHGWTRLLMTMGFTYVAFEGYEVIAQAGDETIDPRRNLPKAMLLSVVIVTIIYILVAFATVVSVSPDHPDVGNQQVHEWIGGFKEKGFGEAISKLMPFGNLILTLAVIFSSTSALNATIYSATRASYALGRDKMLPSLFSRIHSRRKTPYGALLCTAAIVLITVTLLPTEDVASSASIMFLFLFFLANLCVIKIRRAMADELTYGFLMPLFPLFPILAIIFQILLAAWLIHMSLIAWIIAPIWVLSGTIIFFIYSRSRAARTEEDILIIEEDAHPRPSENKYPIMVALANPDRAASLVNCACRLGPERDAHFELIHMAIVPDQVALHDAQPYIRDGKDAISIAQQCLAEAPVSVSATIRYCRGIARGIVSAIREKKTRLLVLGWHGKPTSSLFTVGSTIDPIIEQSPCDIVVLKGIEQNYQYHKILVPIAGGPNSGLALQVAARLCESSEPDLITVLHVDTGRGAFSPRRFVDNLCEKHGIARNRFKIKVIYDKDPASTILNMSEDHDLVVLGTTQKAIFAPFSHESLPEEIARRCSRPVAMVKAGQGIRSWIKRWI